MWVAIKEFNVELSVYYNIMGFLPVHDSCEGFSPSKGYQGEFMAKCALISLKVLRPIKLFAISWFSRARFTDAD